MLVGLDYSGSHYMLACFPVSGDVSSSSIRFSVPSLERVGNGITAQTVITTTNSLVSSSKCSTVKSMRGLRVRNLRNPIQSR